MGHGSIIELPWESQPQDPADPAPEFFSATTLARHIFVNSGTTIGAKKSGIVHTSNGSSTYLSRVVAIRAVPPLFVAAYFRRTGAAAAGAVLYGIGENTGTGAFIGLRAGSTGGAGAASVFLRSTAGGGITEVGTNSSVIPLDTDTCMVGVSTSYTTGYVYVNGVKYDTSLTATTPSGSAQLSFETIGALRRNTVSSYYPGDFYAVGYGGAISEERAKFISLNPWAMFAPEKRTIWIPSAGGGATLFRSRTTFGARAGSRQAA